MRHEGLRVAVIVPTYNAQVHLPACLEGLRVALDEVKAAAVKVEVLVVDGGSKDRTVSIAREHGVPVVKAPGTNIAQARNLGAGAVEADVLVFLDADCRPPRDLVSFALEGLEEHGAVGAFYEPAPGQGWVARTWLAFEAKPPGQVPWIPAGTFALRMDAFEAVGGFKASLEASEDVDLGRRLRGAGYSVYHEPRMACEHLGQADTLGAFFRTEARRARSLVASVQEGGGLDGEAITLLLAVYHLLWPIALVLGAFTGPSWFLAALAAGLAPSLAWALTALPRVTVERLPALWILLFVYNMARATALVRYRQITPF